MVIEIVCVFVLALVIIILAVERYFFSNRMLDELSKAQKAVMSRNINEYMAAIQQDKGIAKPQEEPDEISLDNLGDEDFFKLIDRK